MKTRRRFKQVTSLKERLNVWAETARRRPGPERDALLQRANQAENAAYIEDWVNSPGLQLPR